MQKQQRIFMEYRFPIQTNLHSNMVKLNYQIKHQQRRIYNQTDYIIMGKNEIQSMTDARWYLGTENNTDTELL